MAINIYQQIINPVSRESFRAISFDPDAFIMEWIVQAEGYVPFEHIHFHQSETFNVAEGELKVVIDGKTFIAAKGDSITVPIGSRHIAYNNQPGMMKAVVEYMPGLDYDRFMQCLMGLTLDGYIDKKGGVDIPKMGYLLKKMKCQAMARPTSIPAPIFNLSLRLFFLMGAIKGWEKLYHRYLD